MVISSIQDPGLLYSGLEPRRMVLIEIAKAWRMAVIKDAIAPRLTDRQKETIDHQVVTAVSPNGPIENPDWLTRHLTGAAFNILCMPMRMQCNPESELETCTTTHTEYHRWVPNVYVCLR